MDKPTETIELLSAIITDLTIAEEFHCGGASQPHAIALLRHAIKCIELMPELVAALELAKDEIFELDKRFSTNIAWEHARRTLERILIGGEYVQ